MFNISLLNEDTKTLTLAIKALGNAAHPNSVKQIQRLLPRTSHVCGILEPHVIFDAVMALRKFAKVVPAKARDDIFQFSVSRKTSFFFNFQCAVSLTMSLFTN